MNETQYTTISGTHGSANGQQKEKQNRPDPAEPNVHVSEERYRRLFETAQDGILILEAETGRVTDANPFLVNLLGFSRSEMVGKTVGELSPFKDFVSNQAMLKQVQNDGYVRYEDLPLETSDGRQIAVEFVSNVYECGDKKVIQCNIREITRRKRAEAELHLLNQTLEQRIIERTSQLKSANGVLQTFNSSVSHDLQAPLRRIRSFIDLLQQEANLSPSEQSQILTKISDSARQMGKLIEDLMAFSRVGQADLQKADIDLNALVQETLGDFEAQSKERNIKWELHSLPGVSADRALLRMVLVNLISNAMKFTGTRVEAKIEIGDVPSRDGETIIFIRDNGVGFNSKYADKLFGVFQRLHSAADFEGTGIGLANVRRIIDRHGGKTWAEGVVDGGATFYFSLPE
jgi:PAS domain S-box-containing protein